MKRSVVSCTCLVVAMVAIGCTKSPPSPSKPSPDKDTGPQASTAPDSQSVAPPATADTKPATDVAADAVPGGTAQPDMAPPANVAPPAPQLPFADLVAALENPQASEAYGRVEEQLAQNPNDVMIRVQRLYLLNQVGSALCATDKKEKGLETFRAVLEQAQAMVADPGLELPEGADQVLGGIFYNGACAQSLDGKPEDALVTLQKAVELGFTDLNNLRNDADLDAVRALSGFDQQLAGWETLIAEQLAKEAAELLATGETFPFDFAVTDLAGQSISLAGYLGKVLIVDIWGTWCPPCRAEIPSFVRLQNEYGPQGLQIIGLNYERTENEAEATELVNKFMQENAMNYPCALGTEDIQNQVPNFQGFPTTMFIDRTGKVRAKVVGAHDYAFLEAIIKILLAEAAPPPAAPTDTPPAAASDTPPAAPSDTPPTDAPPAGEGTPPTDAPAEPGK